MLILDEGRPTDGHLGNVGLFGAVAAGIRERYAMDPQIKYFHTACVTDNSAEAVLLPEPAE